ncbi:MAG: hypothetical protein P3X23_009005 [Thermosynechococcus sp. Uc]|nr:hypothetical protein [Thermosynechococcus sp. Uc]MDM7327235.1 hypothetical protein [Thermosynechococcus sp. Uc]
MHLTDDRLQLRIPELKTDAAFRDSLSAYLKTLQGIKSVHVNFLAASISLEYHIEQIRPLQLLAAIHSWGNLQMIGQGNKGLQNLTRAFDLEPEEVGNKLTSMGSYVGDFLGGMVGGIAAGLFIGLGGASRYGCRWCYWCTTGYKSN